MKMDKGVLRLHQPSEYKYRVSGHNKMIKLPNGKIAKQATEKERSCYEQIMRSNSDLARFSASYFGLQPIEIISPSNEPLCRPEGLRYSLHLDDDISESSEFLQHEPIFNGYLVLEDLNKSYVHHCILDVKIGTRTYWDGAPPQKIERHNRMCQSTTSGSLGMRVCGMRVYRPQSHDWLIEDKEWGKSLIAKSMLLAIALFFFDGNSFRLDVLEIVLEKLLNLRDIVRRSNWRFWSSSFLFTYEGEGETRADVHLIDFGNCNFSDCYDTPDEGCILALSNMIAYIRLIQNGAVGLSEIRRFEASL